MKYFFFLLLFVSQNLYAQEATDAFVVSGKVKAEKTITVSDLLRYPTTELRDVNVSCSPRREDRVPRVQVVSLKTVLDSVQYDAENRRLLNEFYFVFEATDGYRIVFSFNEIYNTEIGNHLYLVTRMNGKSLPEMDNRILLLTTKDLKSGPRNMKGLSKIRVCRAE